MGIDLYRRATPAIHLAKITQRRWDQGRLFGHWPTTLITLAAPSLLATRRVQLAQGLDQYTLGYHRLAYAPGSSYNYMNTMINTPSLATLCRPRNIDS